LNAVGSGKQVDTVLLSLSLFLDMMICLSVSHCVNLKKAGGWFGVAFELERTAGLATCEIDFLKRGKYRLLIF
jgi:hypothetical protein